MDRRKILLVDDEEDLRKMLRFRLEALGFEIEEASDGQEALNRARSIRPDLIILDLMLPKIDGFKICRMLKFDEKYKGIPIIMFTARAQESDKKIGKDTGADAYMAKPFEVESLISKIKELLSKT